MPPVRRRTRCAPTGHTPRSPTPGTPSGPTLGKGQAPVPLPAGPAFDVLGWVATADQQANTAQATLAAAVTRARRTGASWAVIGAQLGLTRQGAQQRFTRACRPDSTTTQTPGVETGHGPHLGNYVIVHTRRGPTTFPE